MFISTGQCLHSQTAKHFLCITLIFFLFLSSYIQAASTRTVHRRYERELQFLAQDYGSTCLQLSKNCYDFSVCCFGRCPTCVNTFPYQNCVAVNEIIQPQSTYCYCYSFL